MSYRDLRNLCEILRTVGYPRLVSIENFRNPNFPLVAEIGSWLVHQYEPKADLSTNVQTETERVIFIRTFAEFVAMKVHVSLNTKRLYQADGYAVKELIKVASVLHNAMKEAQKIEPGVVRVSSTHVRFDISSKMDELKETRSLASEITQKGVTLYDILSKEVVLREARQAAISKAFEQDDIQRLLNSAIQAASSEVSKFESMINNVHVNLENLDTKIEKKQLEIERSQKRLHTLKKVRPAFMDEYEKLQSDLSDVYQEYVNRFRCLSYLQNQMEEMNKAESERKAEERLNRLELSAGEDLLYNSKGDNAYSESEESSEEDPIQLSMNTRDFMNSRASKVNNSISGRPQATANSIRSNNSNRSIGPEALRAPLARGRQLYGSMLGGGDESGESESDLILVDGDNSELGSDDQDDDDEDLLLQNAANKMSRNVGLSGNLTDKLSMNMSNGTPGLDAPLAPTVPPGKYDIHDMNGIPNGKIEMNGIHATTNGSLVNGSHYQNGGSSGSSGAKTRTKHTMNHTATNRAMAARPNSRARKFTVPAPELEEEADDF